MSSGVCWPVARLVVGVPGNCVCPATLTPSLLLVSTLTIVGREVKSDERLD